MEAENEYAIFDKNGMTIEKSENFDNKISGHLTDIVQKSREVLNSKDTINSIEIFSKRKSLC